MRKVPGRKADGVNRKRRSKQMADPEKLRENRLRRIAKRQGLELHKSRTRNKRAWDYGLWVITDEEGKVVAGAGAGGRPELTLDDVEVWLTR
jgi:hypothetical protein